MWALTMIFIAGMAAGMALALFALFVGVALLMVHRPRYVAPTLRRRYRDLPIPEAKGESLRDATEDRKSVV